MILDKIYTDFLSHTSLADSTYKSVFVKIQDVFDKLNSLKILSFYYRLNEDHISVDFTTIRDAVPVYVVDLIDNLFEKSYTFPENSEARLDVLYQGSKTSIIQKNNVVEIPVELKFIETMHLFPFFCILKSQLTLFDEFDRLFKFLEFKQPLRSVYGPLKQLFERSDNAQRIDSGSLTTTTSVSYAIIAEDLQNKKEALVKELEALKEKRTAVATAKNELLQFARFKDTYNSEYLALNEEHKTLFFAKEELEKKVAAINHVMVEIDDKLANQSTLEAADTEFYKNKKTYLLEKRGLLDAQIQQTQSLLTTTKVRIEEIKAAFTQAEKFSEFDLKESETTVQRLDREIERYYDEIQSVEISITKAKQAGVASEIAVSSSSLSAIDTVSLQTIPDHLAKPDLPSSVTVVKNYLKYYFVYHADKLVKERGTMQNSVLEGSRLALLTYFGFDPCLVFSREDILGFKHVVRVKG